MSRASSMAGADSPPVKWRSISPDRYLVAGWNGEFAVYHRPSGKTHFLNDAGLLLISDILTRPQTIENAARELSGCKPNESCDPEYVREVAKTIARLYQIGFLEPA